MDEILRRVGATEKTEQRFRDRPFDWAKSATCIHLVRYHAAQLGHELPIVPRFRSALGAKKALKATGFDTLPDLMDAHFERVPPAFLRVGDVLAWPGTDGFDALFIKGDRTKFLGWGEGRDGCTIADIDVSQAIGAWRL